MHVLVADDVAAVPPIAIVEAVAEPTPTPPQPVVRELPTCPDEHIVLTAPAINDTLSGYAAVMGSAILEDLWFYKLEWAPAGSTEFAYFGGNGRSVEEGNLGTLDTRLLANGDYIIRVTVVDQTGNYPTPCDVPVTIEN